MKNLTNFHKTVETSVDLCLKFFNFLSSEIQCYKFGRV